MNDNLSKEQRSKNMKQIKSVLKLEDRFASGLWRSGVRFRRNDRKLFGTPDISIKKYRIVIFIDSCFWHQCPLHGNIPKSNIKFWKAKLNRNVERDQEVNEHYSEGGWTIIRIWEHDLKNDFKGMCENIAVFIKNKSK